MTENQRIQVAFGPDQNIVAPDGYELALTEHENGELLYFWRRSGWEVLEAADALADVVHAWEEKEDGYVFDLVDCRHL